jgi:serine phosphatase RsbU (regulator of sigma subunit)
MNVPEMGDWLEVEIPAVARYHHSAIEQIGQSVEEGVFCALLGPRLSGKTKLLRYIEHGLAKSNGWTCVFLNLLELRATTQQTFFSDLIRATAQQLAEQTGQALPVPEESEASSAVFRGFLMDILEMIGRDVILIIDPLEALPTDLVQALLTSLRAAYMDQLDRDQRAIVIVSGALSLATLTVGESSPFRGIARRVFIGDLSRDDSLSLMQDFLMEQEVTHTPQALKRLLLSTCGDIYLIRRISQHCAEIANQKRYGMVRSRDVTSVINRFLRSEVYQYAPLLEAIRLIEEDPDLMQCILMLLERQEVPRSELPLPLSPDLDPLYLTGVVEKVDGEHYRLQNLIYRQFLAKHFIPGKVGHVLAMGGRWDSAIGYLEASIQQGDSQSRTDILPATINSIYAAQDMTQAAHFLRRGLTAAFGVRQVQVWYQPPKENFLKLVGPAEINREGEVWADLSIPTSADRLEARAFRYQVPLRGQEGVQGIVRAIPLRALGDNPVGVVTISEEPGAGPFEAQRERDLQLVGFLNLAARALQAVNIRRQELALAGRMQSSLLPYLPPEITGWQVSAAWRPARETSGDFYDFIPLPGRRVGIVIADVVDKGMGAALLMALTRTLIRTYAVEYHSQPVRVLQAANQRIIQDVDVGMFVTAFYGVLDPASGELMYANAGHPPPYLFRGLRGERVSQLDATGIPLGISEEAAWETGEVKVRPGELLLAYTDGLQDAQNQQGEFFGDERTLETVKSAWGQSAQAVQEALIAKLFAFSAGQPQTDDITLTILSREEVAEAALPTREAPVQITFRGRQRVF